MTATRDSQPLPGCRTATAGQRLGEGASKRSDAFILAVEWDLTLTGQSVHVSMLDFWVSLSPCSPFAKRQLHVPPRHVPECYVVSDFTLLKPSAAPRSDRKGCSITTQRCCPSSSPNQRDGFGPEGFHGRSAKQAQSKHQCAWKESSDRGHTTATRAKLLLLMKQECGQRYSVFIPAASAAATVFAAIEPRVQFSP